MIRYYFKQGQHIERTEDVNQATWINISSPFDPKELENFANHYDFPLDFLTDSLDIDERSRYEREENANLILFNTPFLNDSQKENEAIYYTVPIGIILVDGKIVTISNKENAILDKFLENGIKNFNPGDEKLFVLQLFEQNVIYFLDCLKKLTLKRGVIEQELYYSSRNRELQQLLRIEKSLVYFVNSLSANELLKMKMKRTDLLNIRDLEHHADLFEDVIIDNTQALEMANVHTKVLGGTMETYASIVSNNMNAFINRLTVITITLMVPTLVYSFFGMNMPIPGKDFEYTYLIVLVISFIFVGGLIFYMSRNRRF